MKIVKYLLASLIIVLFVVGCASPTIHKTAREFRADTSTHSIDTYVVNRPYRDVVRTYKKMTPRCLNVTIAHHTTNVKYADNGTYRYTSRVRSYKNRTEIATQKFQLGLEEYAKRGEIPKNGIYVLMVEAEPVSSNKTKITIRIRNWMYPPSEFVTAIKGWSSGEYIGCPSFE